MFVLQFQGERRQTCLAPLQMIDKVHWSDNQGLKDAFIRGKAVCVVCVCMSVHATKLHMNNRMLSAKIKWTWMQAVSNSNTQRCMCWERPFRNVRNFSTLKKIDNWNNSHYLMIFWYVYILSLIYFFSVIKKKTIIT